jgi:uncharacterized protein (TIGR02246 family)
MRKAAQFSERLETEISLHWMYIVSIAALTAVSGSRYRMESVNMKGLNWKLRQYILALVFLSSGLFVACQQDTQESDLIELNEFAMRYAAAWSSQDPERLASFYAVNGILQIIEGDPSVGRGAVTETARRFMSAFPDMVIDLVELRREGDEVQFHWHWTGTYTGPGGNGNAVDLRGYEQWTLDDNGSIRQSLGHYDENEYQRQLHAGQ